MGLELAHATYAATAAAAGARPRDIGEFTDPADLLADQGDAGRDADPVGRAAQVRAFLAASEQAGETSMT